MKLFAQILFTISIAVASLSVCAAQTTSSKPAKIVGDAKVSQSKDKPMVESVFLNRNGKFIKASFNAPTTEMTKPRIVKLEFNGFWKGGGKPTNLRAEIMWNENESFAGETVFTVKQCYREDKIECYEFLFTLSVPYETFEKLSKSENVTINFNETPLKLTTDELNGLRNLE